MTERERFDAVLHFRQPDRVPNVEIGYWHEALQRWRGEGLPPGMPLSPPKGDKRYTRHSRELTEYFGIDAHNIAFAVGIGSQTDPAPAAATIAEDEDTKTVRYSDGYVQRHLKSNAGIFHELDWAVKSREDWERKKAGYHPGWWAIAGGSPENLPADGRDFAVWADLPGFFWVIRQWMGFEGACTLFADDPTLAREMVGFWADYLVAQSEILFTRVKPEFVAFAEDMAYNHGSMLSPAALREFLLLPYGRVAAVIRSFGIDVIGIESDGFVDEMIPVLAGAGINLWLPFERQCRAGKNDLLALGQAYPWLRMIGGMDKTALAKDREAIDREVAAIPPLVHRGGFIPMVDHKVPPEVSLDNYRYYIEKKTRRLAP
jgi:hypothetical protein